MARIIEYVPGRYKVDNEVVTIYTHQLHVNNDNVGIWNVGNKRYVDGEEKNYSDWVDINGNNYTSLENLINDLDNFFFLTSDSDGVNGLLTDYRASNFNDISNVAPSPEINETVFVEYGQGVYYINRKPGQTVYIWNGTNWSSDLEEITTRLGITVDAVNSMVLINSNQDTAIAQNTSNILNETSARVLGDNNLQSNINNEIALREQGDEGSVTVHNDVDNAGSGSIISNQERIDINASIGVHNDVDLSSVNIQQNSVLRWDGNNFIPCINPIIRSSPLTINNTSTFQTKLSVNVDIQRIVTHKVNVNYNWSVNDGGQDIRVLLSFGGERLQNALTESDIHRQEPKDTAGNSLDGRGTNQIHSYSKSFFIVPNAVGNNNLSLQFAGSANGDLVSIWEVVVEVEELVTIIGN